MFKFQVIITSAGFLIFGGKNKGKKDFDPSKFKDGNMTPPSGFSGEKGDFDPSKFDPNNIPEKNNSESNENS